MAWLGHQSFQQDFHYEIGESKGKRMSEVEMERV
jgi:hypothetical protein